MSDLSPGWEAHAALRGPGLIGTAGFAAPVAEGAVSIAVEPANLERLKQCGITVHGPLGSGNSFLVDPAMRHCAISVALNGQSDNSFVIEPGAWIKASVTVLGSGNAFVFMRTEPRRFNLNIDCRATGGAVYLGRHCSAAAVNLWLEGEQTSIFLGEDAQCSWGIWIRVGEGHGVIDLRTRRQMNQTGSVVVGPHVWLGQDVIISKGVTIGAGSIIGGRSIVTKSVPPTSLAVGAPARVIRRDVSWTRSAQPSAMEIDRVADLPYLPPIGPDGPDKSKRPEPRMPQTDGAA